MSMMASQDQFVGLVTAADRIGVTPSEWLAICSSSLCAALPDEDVNK